MLQGIGGSKPTFELAHVSLGTQSLVDQAAGQCCYLLAIVHEHNLRSATLHAALQAFLRRWRGYSFSLESLDLMLTAGRVLLCCYLSLAVVHTFAWHVQLALAGA